MEDSLYIKCEWNTVKRPQLSTSLTHSYRLSPEFNMVTLVREKLNSSSGHLRHLRKNKIKKFQKSQKSCVHQSHVSKKEEQVFQTKVTCSPSSCHTKREVSFNHQVQSTACWQRRNSVWRKEMQVVGTGEKEETSSTLWPIDKNKARTYLGNPEVHETKKKWTNDKIKWPRVPKNHQ